MTLTLQPHLIDGGVQPHDFVQQQALDKARLCPVVSALSSPGLGLAASLRVRARFSSLSGSSGGAATPLPAVTLAFMGSSAGLGEGLALLRR